MQASAPFSSAKLHGKRRPATESATKTSPKGPKVKLEERLSLVGLESLKNAFQNDDFLDSTQFHAAVTLALNLDSNDEQEVYDLFEKIDLANEGRINWDQFCSHMLMCYFEREDKVKATQVPHWKTVKILPNHHKESIQGFELQKNPSRYVTVSKDGCVCTWTVNARPALKEPVRIQLETIRKRDLWVTAFSLMPALNKLFVTLTTKELLIYDVTALPEFVCRYRVSGMTATPLSMDAWSCDDGSDEGALIFGDADGNVVGIMFSTISLHFFDPVSKYKADASSSSSPPPSLTTAPSADREFQGGSPSCANVKLKDLEDGHYKSVRIVKHSHHLGWVRRVRYIPSLDAVISSATTDKNSIILGYIEKSSSVMRTIIFSIQQGICDFDYSRSINMIVSGGADRMIRLWNPYVTAKPVGIMEGHTTAVVAVHISTPRGQIFSICAQKVFRVWDIKLQVCLQVLTGCFPRGPSVSTRIYFDETRERLWAAFNNQLCLMEIKPDARNRVLTHERAVTCIVFSSKLNQVVTGSAESMIGMWMLDTGQKVRKIPHAHGDAEIMCMAVSQNQRRFLTGASDGLIKIWDFNTGVLHLTLQACQGLAVDISQIVCISQGVVSVGWERSPTLFRVQEMTSSAKDSKASEWTGGQEHVEDIVTVAYCAPHHVATASQDGEIILWNIYSQRVARRLNARARLRSPDSVQRSRKATHTTSMLSSLQLQEARMSSQLSSEIEMQVATSFTVHKLFYLNERAKHKKAAQLVSCGSGSWVRFWNIDTSQCMAEFVAHQSVAFIVAVTADDENRYLATGSPSGEIKVWDIQNYCTKSNENRPPICISSWTVHTDSINSLLLLERNKSLLVVSASADCCCSVWDIYGTPVGTFGQDEHWKISSSQKDSSGSGDAAESRKASASLQQKEMTTRQEQSSERNHKSSQLTIADGAEDPFDDERVATASRKNNKIEQKEEEDEEEEEEEEEEGNDEKEETSFSVWSKTSLGITYQAERAQKRPRKQPRTLPPLRLGGKPADPQQYPAGHPIVLGPEASPYQRLQWTDCSSSDGFRAPKKPEMLTNPDKYFADSYGPDAIGSVQAEPEIRQMTTKKTVPVSKAHVAWKDLQARFDEISLFPKHFWEISTRSRNRRQAMSKTFGGLLRSPRRETGSTQRSRSNKKTVTISAEF